MLALPIPRQHGQALSGVPPRPAHVRHAKRLAAAWWTDSTVGKRGDFALHIETAAGISDGTPMAWIDWDAVIAALDAGRMPASGRENGASPSPPSSPDGRQARHSSEVSPRRPARRHPHRHDLGPCQLRES
jgi:hypothetical protein